MQLQDGPKHRKTESMPETLFEMPELQDSPGGGSQSGQDVTVTRSHSDSHKRNASLECVDIADITSVEDGNKKVWAHWLSAVCYHQNVLHV